MSEFLTALWALRGPLAFFLAGVVLAFLSDHFSTEDV